MLQQDASFYEQAKLARREIKRNLWASCKEAGAKRPRSERSSWQKGYEDTATAVARRRQS
eukprot:8691599-Karenia_brevis.AAC.1